MFRINLLEYNFNVCVDDYKSGFLNHDADANNEIGVEKESDKESEDNKDNK